MIEGRDFDPCPAIPSDCGGRASGGLEMYTPTGEKKERISTTSHHIALKLDRCVVIGVYYQPEIDFDDKMFDLFSALTHCNKKFPSLPVIIGGDFNIHYDSADYRNLEETLDFYNIELVSNPSIPTFTSNRGNLSIPDHIFASRSIRINSFNVPQRT